MNDRIFISQIARISFEGIAQAAAMKERVATAADRMMWRDIAREFNFKAAMRGKAMLKKRERAIR